MEHKQTWWDKDIKDRFEEFKSWVGDANVPSKVWLREFLAKEKDIKSLINLGCGLNNEFEAFQKQLPHIKYMGLDSSTILVKHSKDNYLPIIKADAHDTRLVNDHFDVAYSRHVLEHQHSFRPILKEMVRIAKKMAIHIFFITPKEEEIINYSEKQNLYHNTFSKEDIEIFLKELGIKNIEWVPITSTETALIIRKT